MWDLRGHLIATIEFRYGKMHGKCRTWNPQENMETSVASFQNGLPNGYRFRRGLGSDVYLKTKECFEPGACDHRVRVKMTAFYEFNQEIPMEKPWGLHLLARGDWSVFWFSTKKLRDSNNLLYFVQPESLLGSNATHYCGCGEERLRRKRLKRKREVFEPPPLWATAKQEESPEVVHSS